MGKILTIADLKKKAQRRVPKMFFDYADSGAWTESTYRANEEDFQKIKLRQRVLVDMTDRSLATEMIGQKVSMPVALSPTGLTGMQHADGEMLAAKAAEEFGVPFTLSTMSICSIEDVASVTSKPFWFQLYVMKDRDFINNLIDRAKAAKCSALVLTLDLQILGQRHRICATACQLRRNSRRNTSGRWRRARNGAWTCCKPNAAASATSLDMPRTSLTCPRYRPGQQNNSIRVYPGRMSNGSRNAGVAS